MLRRRQIPKLHGYIEERGGSYALPPFRVACTAEEVLRTVTPKTLDAPATVIYQTDGVQLLYGYVSWIRNHRTLVVARLPDERVWLPGDPVYDADPAFERIASVPRSVIRHGWQFECATCGVTAFYAAPRPRAEILARDDGWHETTARGWVCRMHYYHRWRGNRSQRAKMRPRTAFDAGGAS